MASAATPTAVSSSSSPPPSPSSLSPSSLSSLLSSASATTAVLHSSAVSPSFEFAEAQDGHCSANVWPAAEALLSFLSLHPSLLQDRCVIELGAGTGWLALQLCRPLNRPAPPHLPRRYIATEMETYGALDRLRDNLSRHRHEPTLRTSSVQSCLLESCSLDWAQVDESILCGTEWDLLVGSDLVYNEMTVQLFSKAVSRLLEERQRRAPEAPSPVMYYAHTLYRWAKHGYDVALHHGLRSAGLSYRLVWAEGCAEDWVTHQWDSESIALHCLSLPPQKKCVVFEIESTKLSTNPSDLSSIFKVMSHASVVDAAEEEQWRRHHPEEAAAQDSLCEFFGEF